MSFEKEFPSLKLLIQHGECVGDFNIIKEDVQKHCLDKQKVKEAFDKHLLPLMDLPVNRRLLYDFKEEVGL